MRNPLLRRAATRDDATRPATRDDAVRPATSGHDGEPGQAGAPGFGAFLRYFLGLGTWGFGGPIATVGYMQRDLIERRWLTESEFLDGVTLGQTRQRAAGPEMRGPASCHRAPR